MSDSTALDLAALQNLARIFDERLPLRGPLGSLMPGVVDAVDTAAEVLAVGVLRADRWGVYASLRTARREVETEGSLFLMRRDQLADPRAPAFVAGLCGALTELLARSTAASMKQWAIGYLNEAPPLELLGPGADEAAWRETMLGYPWFGRLLPTRPSAPPEYERAPARAVMIDGALDFTALGAWIDHFARRTYTDPRWDEACRRQLPPPARTLHALYEFSASAGGGGFEVYLSQTQGVILREVLAALTEVGCESLAAMMTRGLALAADQGAEFSHERGPRWWAKLGGEAPEEGWRALDGHEPGRSWYLLRHELEPRARGYAEAHRSALIREPGEVTSGVIRRRGARRGS